MQLSVTFRHMDTTEALKDYATEKVDRINKFLPDPIKAHVVLSIVRGYQHVASVTITLHNGILIKGEESTEDMYSSIDKVMDKIEQQVRRYKEKIRKHRPTIDEVQLDHSVFAAPAEEMEGEAPQPDLPVEMPAVAAVAVTKSKFVAHPLTVDEAIMQMNLLGEPFLVFTNALSREVNVLYRRDDGTFGVIETGATK